MKRIIIAFDLGAQAAWACNAADGRPKYGPINAGPPGPENRGQRFSTFHDMAQSMMELRKVHAVVYERPFARGQAATRGLWGFAAAVEAAAYEAGVPCLDITPNEVKACFNATGKRATSKDLMQIAAQDLGYVGSNEHEADAICLLAYAERFIEWGTAVPGEDE